MLLRQAQDRGNSTHMRSLRKFEKPNIKFGLSLQNGTTSTKEIATAKSEIVTLPQTHDLHF